MIKGDLYFSRLIPNQTSPPVTLPLPSGISMPIWGAQPWVDAEIEIPSLTVKRPVTFMVDTGATGTVLNVRDAVPMMGKWGYRTLQRTSEIVTSIGIGGDAYFYNVNARIVFQGTDGSLEGYSFELLIAKPAKKGSKKLGLQLRIPSILGRDILCQFRMVMDYSKHELSLDH